MRVVVTGGTGFIGRGLVTELLRRGYSVAVPSREPRRVEELFRGSVTAVAWDGCDPTPLAELMSTGEETAVVNLAGENIASGRWTEARKRRIRDSRVLAGRAVVEAARFAQAPPRVVVQASAVGYYGPQASQDGMMLGEGQSAGTGFLACVCEAWEAASQEVERFGVRRVVVRLGLVLGRTGGVLDKFVPPFRMYVGGPLGSGKQWLPWVHRDDVAGAIAMLIADEGAQGIYNLCAPEPVTMSRFCHELGRVMHRPSWLPVPAVALRLLLGAEMGRETVLASQRAIPERLLAEGYVFQKSELTGALRACLG